MKLLILNQAITHILLKCSCSPNLMGFDYLREVIRECCLKGNFYQSNIGEAYRRVARNNRSTVEKMDKRIRAMLKDAQSRKGFLAVNEYFNQVVYNGNKDIPNQKAIALLIEMSRLEFSKRMTNFEKLKHFSGNAC